MIGEIRIRAHRWPLPSRSLAGVLAVRNWLRVLCLSAAFGSALRLRRAALVLCCLLLPGAGHAEQATFLWEYDDPRATGFVLYCGTTSGFYDQRIVLGNATSATVSGLAAGTTYYCSVTASNAAEESSFSNEIPVTPVLPPQLASPAFTMSIASGPGPLSVTFEGKPEGGSSPISSWSWNFGDGSGSTLANPTTHEYTTPGRYTVVLTASGPGGSVSRTAAVSVVVGSANAVMNAVRTAVGAVIEALPPATNFTVDSAEGTAPFTVTFTNSTTGGSSWNWDFGDGTTGTEHSPTHTYYQPGEYTVVLTASGPGGTVLKSVTAMVKVQAAPVPPPGEGCLTGTPSDPPVFGDDTQGAAAASPMGVAVAFSTTAGNCGKAGSLRVYLDASSTAGRVIVGVYSDRNGHPDVLLAQGSTSSPIAGAWNTVTIAPKSVSTGAVYWIAILGTQSGTLYYHSKQGGCAAEPSAQTNLTALPSVWTTGTGVVSCPPSAYGVSTP